ncbi:MAG: toll/interleukin-1 receptor domain-containing protein, partial [Gammaproteobacteria bacterium]
MIGLAEVHDLFLSYSGADRAQAEQLEHALQQQGLRVARDRTYLKPGLAWQPKLEQVLCSCTAVAVLVGEDLGRWQRKEIELALDRQARQGDFPVVPVLLPKADLGLSFLAQNTWLDLSEIEVEEAAKVLVATARGRALPERITEASVALRARVCPYRGLQVFREQDARFFFGRDAFVKDLLGLVDRDHHSLVAVVGNSGSGKSSVVQAGLLPSLRQRRASAVWEIAVMEPGDKPLHALAGALLPSLDPEHYEHWDWGERQAKQHEAVQTLRDPVGAYRLRDMVRGILERQPGTQRVLVVVDQWEQLYTFRTEDEREARVHAADGRRFLDELLHASDAGSLTVVLTVRADFWPEVLRSRALVDRLHQAKVDLGPMTREELGAVIREPARKVALGLEEGLEARLLDAVGDEPGNLPLLEFALKTLWETKNPDRLLMTHAAYDQFGGLEGAITDRADRVLGRLRESERNAARRALLALVNPGEGAIDTSRQASLAAMSDEERAVVQTLANERLLVTGGGLAGEETVRVAHEALIRNWETLRGWVGERRDDLRLLHQLRTQAEEWRKSGGKEKYRWPHERVRDASQALARLRQDVRLSKTVEDFLGPVDPAAMLAELNQETTDHERRVLIGERLAVLGDPRPGLGLRDGGIPDIAWCDVPPGEITLELERRRLWGKTRKHKQVERFRISQYLVTYAQYRAFVEAKDGYRDERWWGDL